MRRLARPFSLAVLLCVAAADCSTNMAEGTVAPNAAAVVPFGTLSSQLRVPPLGPDACNRFKGQRLYVAVTDGNNATKIEVFDAKASGNVSPICTITYTPMYAIGGLTVDPAGHLWAMICNHEPGSLLVFPHAQNDGSNPIQDITGSKTELSGSCYAQATLAIDSSGNTWAPDNLGSYVIAFANDANGNVSPIASIGLHDHGQSESISRPQALVFDKDGNLYVAENTLPGTIDVFQPPFTDTSKPIAQWTVPGGLNGYALYLATDKHDNLYLAGQTNLDIYPGALKSNGVPSVEMSNTPYIGGLAVDDRGNLYVSAQTNSASSIDVLGRLPTSYKPVRQIFNNFTGDNYTIGIGS